MNRLDAILGAQGRGAAQQLGRQFGLNEGQVSSALSALVPALAAGFQHNMSSRQGLDGLISALGGGQHQRYVEDPGALGRPDTTADGNGILGHIFGSKDVSRRRRHARRRRRDWRGCLKAMFPVVAAMAMGTMSKRMVASPTPMRVGAVREGLVTWHVHADARLDRDGSIVDDVVGMLGRMAGR